jgi:hypothetical protein
MRNPRGLRLPTDADRVLVRLSDVRARADAQNSGESQGQSASCTAAAQALGFVDWTWNEFINWNNYPQ